jgi:hypothetical protein
MEPATRTYGTTSTTRARASPRHCRLACFLALIVDSETSIRFVGCQGSIVSRLVKDTGAISWCCPACGHNGVIVDWQGTKWDQSNALK